jgi:hypothetical protein
VESTKPIKRKRTKIIHLRIDHHRGGSTRVKYQKNITFHLKIAHRSRLLISIAVHETGGGATYRIRITEFALCDLHTFVHYNVEYVSVEIELPATEMRFQFFFFWDIQPHLLNQITDEIVMS